MADAAKVGYAADIPQKTYRCRITGPVANCRILRQRFERHQIVGLTRLDQYFMVGT